MKPQPIVRIQNLHTRMSNTWIHHNISFNIMPQECFILMGMSGSGKSVLLKEILGIMSPMSGHIFIDGHNMTTANEKQKMNIRLLFNILFQNAGLLDSLNIFQNIAFPLTQHSKYLRHEIQNKVYNVLKDVELPISTLSLMPENLSMGMKKRAGLARAIISNPKIVLYDEPTTGLEPNMANIITNLIQKTGENKKITSIIVSHDIERALAIGNKFAFLYKGTLLGPLTKSEVLHSEHPHIQDFLNKRFVPPY